MDRLREIGAFESFSFLYKEKNWFWKLIIPFLPMVVMGFFLLIFVAITFFSLESTTRTSTITINTLNNLNALNFFVLIGFVILFLIIGLISFFISYWYQYEFTQSALQKRESRVYFSASSSEIIKRSFKLFFIDFIYNIPFVIAASLIIIVAISQLSFSNTMNSFNDQNSFLTILLLSCGFLIIFIVYVLYNFLLVQSAKVLVIKTNTFSRGLNVSKVIEELDRNIGNLGWFFLAIAFFSFLYSLVNIVLTVLGFIPIIGFLLGLPFQILVSFLYYFFVTFSYPWMVGKVYSKN